MASNLFTFTCAFTCNTSDFGGGFCLVPVKGPELCCSSEELRVGA